MRLTRLSLAALGCLQALNCKGGNGGSGRLGGNSGAVGSNPLGGSNFGGYGGSGGAVQSTLVVLGAPKTITTVNIPDVDPAWPIGEWGTGSYTTYVEATCGGSQSATSDVVSLTVTGGSGTNYNVTVDSLVSPLCSVTAHLSDGKDALIGDVAVCGFINQTRFVLRPTSIGGDLSTTAISLSCTYNIDHANIDYGTNSKPTYAKGTIAQPLASPLELRGWAALATPAFGQGGSASTAYRKPLALPASATLPSGLVWDASAYAVKVPNATGFHVFLGLSNQSGESVCFYPGRISSVDNSAGLPIATKFYDYAAFPGLRVSVGKCLRAGEKGWLINAVEADNASAWDNAAQIALDATTPVSLFAGDDTSLGTPYQFRYNALEGVEIDVADPGPSTWKLYLIYLDAEDKPITFDIVLDDLPAYGSSALTFHGDLPDTMGQASKVMVYPEAD